MSFLGSLFNIGKSVVKNVGGLAFKGTPIGAAIGIANQVQRLVAGGAGVSQPIITPRATFGSFGDGLTQTAADSVGLRLAQQATVPVITAPMPSPAVAPYLFNPPGQTGVGGGPVNTVAQPGKTTTRKAKTKRAKAKKAKPRSKKRGRKLKFGSPAWRKKYLGHRRKRAA